MAVIYRHTRLDNNTVFYIGIGKEDKRAYSKKGRNNYWKNIVNLCGYEVEILKKDLSWEDACELERALVSWYGRNDLGLGLLVNMTDGGDGIINQVFSKETREKLRLNWLGRKHTDKAKLNMSKIQKGRIITDAHKLKISENNAKYWLGKKLPTETLKKMSIAQSGENNPMYGKTHNADIKRKLVLNNTRTKVVLDIETGVFYDSLSDASNILDIPRSTLEYRIKTKLVNLIFT
jgi:group I intron endonuclease